MIAFAANSVLTRLALQDEAISPEAFSGLRVTSGALALAAFVALSRGGLRMRETDGRSALALSGYLVFFTLAYVALPAGLGALILFGCVQATMLGVALIEGARPRPIAWAGLLLAAAGLVFLLAPSDLGGGPAPDPLATLFMALAGISWGVYSLLGRGATAPVAATARNFIAATPIVLLAGWVTAVPEAQVWTMHGVGFALASGVFASAFGYVLWFAVLPALGAARAAVIQLSAPVLAVIGGASLLAEPITAALLIAGAATLGGVALFLTASGRGAPAPALGSKTSDDRR